MWLLTCDGELFGGKRLWLRPGSTHLLGRTSGRSETGERRRYIDHKSVSRKHLTIQVGHVTPGDSSKLFTMPSRPHHPLCDAIRFKDDPWNDRMAKAVQLFIEGRRILEFEPTATRLPGPAPPQKPPRT